MRLLETTEVLFTDLQKSLELEVGSENNTWATPPSVNNFERSVVQDFIPTDSLFLLGLTLVVNIDNHITGCDIRIFHHWPLGQYISQAHWLDMDFTSPNNLYL